MPETTNPNQFTLITDDLSFARRELLSMRDKYPILAGVLGEKAVKAYENNDLNRSFEEDYASN